jgi:hypothetical protein
LGRPSGPVVFVVFGLACGLFLSTQPIFFFLHCILGSTVWNDTHADQQIIRKSSNSAEMKSPQPKKQAHLISSSAIFFSINTESRNKSSNYK